MKNEFVYFDNDPDPHVIYRPYIYARVRDDSKSYWIERNDRIDVIYKEDKNRGFVLDKRTLKTKNYGGKNKHGK